MLSREAILNSLPHRYPFLFVDQITEINYLQSVEGIKNITMNEPWTPGHFPNDPIFPGVLLIETAAQICGFVFYKEQSNEGMPQSYLSNVKDFKFIKLIRPGDQLVIKGVLVNSIANFAEVKCEVFVQDVVVAKGKLQY